MYLESIVHKIRKAGDAEEAARLLKGGAQAYEAIEWENENGCFVAVSDTHIDDIPFGETALFQKKEGRYFQIESLTVAWMSETELVRKLKYFETSPTTWVEKRLIVDKPHTDDTAQFICGCCGEWFTGNVAYQLAFDQDSGYGICNNCEKYYK